MKALFVTYDTNKPVDFKNLEREINQNAGRNFRPKEVKLFGLEYKMDPQKGIWNNRTLDNYRGIELPETKKRCDRVFQKQRRVQFLQIPGN